MTAFATSPVFDYIAPRLKYDQNKMIHLANCFEGQKLKVDCSEKINYEFFALLCLYIHAMHKKHFYNYL